VAPSRAYLLLYFVPNIYKKALMISEINPIRCGPLAYPPHALYIFVFSFFVFIYTNGLKILGKMKSGVSICTLLVNIVPFQ
jgi:hypothetical protein